MIFFATNSKSDKLVWNNLKIALVNQPGQESSTGKEDRMKHEEFIYLTAHR